MSSSPPQPTAGLDSVMAESVVTQLKELAVGGGRTVIATIHQPSTAIYNTFDKLYFIVDGRCAYFGPTKDVPRYFESIGYGMPPFTNPSDFVMELMVNPNDRS